MDRHKGAATPFQPETAPPPRLEADLGIDRTTAHRWQTIAGLPEPDFEAHLANRKAHGRELTSTGVYQLARGAQKAADRRANMEAEQGPLLCEGVRLLEGNFVELGAMLPAASVDLILTDPPYGQAFVPALDDLGALAARVLKPGGSLLMLYGQSYLPEALQALSGHLRY